MASYNQALIQKSTKAVVGLGFKLGLSINNKRALLDWKLCPYPCFALAWSYDGRLQKCFVRCFSLRIDSQNLRIVSRNSVQLERMLKLSVIILINANHNVTVKPYGNKLLNWTPFQYIHINQFNLLSVHLNKPSHRICV